MSATDEPSPKRHRTELALRDGAGAATADADDDPPVLRTSSLPHPTMKLTGHKGSVYALSYDPRGETLCSGSFDTTCLLWSAGAGDDAGGGGGNDCDNFNVLRGHKNAVLDLAWSHDSERVVTASADKTLAWWDVSRGERVKKFAGHDGVVNAVDAVRESGGLSSPGLVASASDDRTARLWDARSRKRGGEVGRLEHDYQVTAVAFASDGRTVFTGGIDNCIHAWDVRKGERTMTMKGHADTITCLSLSPKGTHLLSNSSDGTLRTWDVRPFAEGKRHRKTFEGATHNAERGLLNCAWSADGTMVTGGSADRVVHIWDEYSTEELYYLPGHSGCVNAVVFHPKENVIASGSSDKTIFVGELAQ